jgi:O-antigen ligase
MRSGARTLVAPAYLLACLVLGGSAQGIWQNRLLQLAGLAIIAWAAIERRDEPVARPVRQLLALAIAAITVVVLQLVPLPASLWAEIGPRARIANGFAVLGMPLPSEPLSLTPATTLDCLLGLIPPLALFCAIVRLKAFRPQGLVIALIAGTALGVALGALQVASAGGGLSGWYLYPETSFGKAVGFFANVDHMATLLVINIPFVAAMVAATRNTNVQRYSAVATAAAAIALVLIVGIALNGSLAGYGLTLAVAPMSALLLIPAQSPVRPWVLAATVLLVIGAVTSLEATSIGSGQLGEHAASASQSRADILATTSRAIGDFMPFGSGLGSFRSVYPLYEQPQLVTSTFVIHAHNDYAEFALELGIAGVVLILLFLAWWGMAVWRTWRTAEAGPYARAAAIASAAILVHTLVDFPARTAAIAACLAMCLALIADHRSAPPKEERELRRKRHVEFR